jgi:carbamoyltransferase
MGLAPYGDPKYAELIREKLITVAEDGSFQLDMSYFDYATGLTMTNKKFDKLFGGPASHLGIRLTQREMDLAASIQKVTEDVVVKLQKVLLKKLEKKTFV